MPLDTGFMPQGAGLRAVRAREHTQGSGRKRIGHVCACVHLLALGVDFAAWDTGWAQGMELRMWGSERRGPDVGRRACRHHGKGRRVQHWVWGSGKHCVGLRSLCSGQLAQGLGLKA